MRAPVIILALAASLVLMACERGPKVDLAAEEKNIRAAVDQWEAAMAAKDAKANADFYAPDGQMFPPGGAIVEGKENLTNAWEGFFALPGFKLTIETTKVSVAQAGDLAYEVGTYVLSFDGDQKPVQDKGKYVVVWKKVDGNWKAAADIFNSDLPPPAPAASSSS